MDKTTGITFLLDTGADVSLLPLSANQGNRTVTPFQLFAANGTKIETFGEKLITLNLGLRRPIPWRFMVTSVPQAVIGADLLKAYGLIVDLEGERIDKIRNLVLRDFITKCVMSQSRLSTEQSSTIASWRNSQESHDHGEQHVKSLMGYVTT